MKKRNTNIRLATTQDLPALYPIYDQARRYMVAMGNPNQWGFYYPEPAVTDADVAAGHCYVVEDADDGTILGVFVYFKGDYAPYSTIAHGQWLNNAPYGVLQRVASAGLGSRFADVVLNWLTAKGDDIRVDTHRDNTNMRNALVRHGFRLCGAVTLDNGEQRIAFQWRKPTKAKLEITPEEQAEILKEAYELMRPKPIVARRVVQRQGAAASGRPAAAASTAATPSVGIAQASPAATPQAAAPSPDAAAPKPMRIARAIRRPKATE